MKSRRILSLLIAALLLLGSLAVLASCGEKKVDPNGTHTVVDHNDNAVEVPNTVRRVVVADIFPLPSVIAVLFDSADMIVGMPAASMAAAKNGLLGELYPEILNAKTDFLNGSEVNLEELLKLEPDVVIYSSDSVALGEQLRGAGLAAIAISADKWEYNAIETLHQWVLLLDQVFSVNGRAEKVQSYSEQVLARVTERVSGLKYEEKQRVFFLFQYSDTTLMTSGHNFFGQWWAEAIGAVNVGGELTNKKAAPVNMEQVYAWDPSLIFITNFTTAQPDDLKNNTIGSYDWSPVAAVKSGAVYKMPLGMYRSYTAGVDTPLTLLWLAKHAYPDLFEDVDLIAETKAYYAELFGITLTDEQASSIFHPAAEAGHVVLG